ncbi:MAG TPA: hypothetical protein VN796_09325 [Acidimicrobiales bacterium]|nr:hypothetical protein [Acidimicrobiales bacterium]
MYSGGVLADVQNGDCLGVMVNFVGDDRVSGYDESAPQGSAGVGVLHSHWPGVRLFGVLFQTGYPLAHDHDLRGEWGVSLPPPINPSTLIY